MKLYQKVLLAYTDHKEESLSREKLKKLSGLGWRQFYPALNYCIRRGLIEYIPHVEVIKLPRVTK